MGVRVAKRQEEFVEAILTSPPDARYVTGVAKYTDMSPKSIHVAAARARDKGLIQHDAFRQRLSRGAKPVELLEVSPDAVASIYTQLRERAFRIAEVMRAIEQQYPEELAAAGIILIPAVPEA